MYNIEECFREISRAIDHVFFLVDLDASRYVYVSPAYEALTGRTSEEACSKNSLWNELVVPETRDKAESEYQRLLSGQEIRSEYQILHKNGSLRWIKLHAFPIFAAEGAAHMSAGVAEDVTERHGLEENLRLDKERFRRILANMPDISYTSDQNGRTIYISPNVEEILGYSSQEVYANSEHLLIESLHPDDLDRVLSAFKALFETQTTFDEEFRIRNKSGQWIWVHDRAVRTHEENGILYADGTLSDITARKEAELDLQSKTALLEAQVNSTIDGILVIDPSGQKILQNTRFTEIFDIPIALFEQTDDRPVLNYAVGLMKSPEEFLAKVEYLYAHPMETSRDEIELKSGVILDRYSSPVVDKNGKYYGRIWTFHDISERKKNEETLRQLSLAVEQSPVSVVITDLNGDITYVNRKFTESTGYTAEEVLNRNPRFLKSGYLSREAYAELWQTITKGGEWRGKLRNRKKNGELFWEEATITPIFGPNREISHYLAVKEDVTERLEIEAQLRQAQKLEAIGQLAAGIAHEINTPAQFVTDNLQFIRDSWFAVSELIEKYRDLIGDCEVNIPSSAKKSLSEIEQIADFKFISDEMPNAIEQGIEGARRIAKIVRAMKEFSHPDSADKVQIDLYQAIESTITVARNEWKYVAEVATEFEKDLPLVVCYPGEINQVVLNLIVNAAHSIKDKPSCDGKGKITIRTAMRGDDVEIAISDTGLGIPDAIRTRIFEPFFTTKEVGKGTGQGLALAHSVIVKKHLGKIWFETEIGRGTTFFIHLPIGPASVQEER
jgi:PAS domain S-box-containing protein